MFRAVSADFNFYISGHNWFSDEQFWTSLIQRWTLLASSKPTKTIKTIKKGVFFFIFDAENFRMNLNSIFFEKFLKYNFRNFVFPFVSISDNFSPEQKTA